MHDHDHETELSRRPLVSRHHPRWWFPAPPSRPPSIVAMLLNATPTSFLSCRLSSRSLGQSTTACTNVSTAPHTHQSSSVNFLPSSMGRQPGVARYQPGLMIGLMSREDIVYAQTSLRRGPLSICFKCLPFRRGRPFLLPVLLDLLVGCPYVGRYKVKEAMVCSHSDRMFCEIVGHFVPCIPTVARNPA
jgi:hypothetical protein